MTTTITIHSPMTLPALSTDVPPRTYTFADFFSEFVLRTKGMRADANLPYLFELEDAFQAQNDSDDLTPIVVSNKAFLAAKTACKEAIDEALTPDRAGRTAMHPEYGSKVLRMYHAFAQSPSTPDK